MDVRKTTLWATMTLGLLAGCSNGTGGTPPEVANGNPARVASSQPQAAQARTDDEGARADAPAAPRPAAEPAPSDAPAETENARAPESRRNGTAAYHAAPAQQEAARRAAPRRRSPRKSAARPKRRHAAQGRRSRGSSAGALGLGSVGVGQGGGSGYGRGAGGLRVARRARVAAEPPAHNREAYQHIDENDFVHVADQPLSTFSADVDTASYSNLRRFLRDGRLPPADAVRVEELINYFDYAYDAPRKDAPFAVHAEVGDCPWNPAHRLVHLGVKGRVIDDRDVPARNLVFLLDVSGSMQSPAKLPLLKRGLELLVRNLRPQDRLAVVVYAGASGLVLPSTPGDRQGTILAALDRLRAGGSTNGAAGIELAYRTAQQHFVKGGINRVILATDGDFNVGPSSQGELTRIIEKKRESGVFLTVLGFGRGNLQDARMETLADKGNGNYAYIDDLTEARKVLVREAGATLVTIAKDVKLQVEFNPAHVASYRLIGYENRKLAARDFNDDTKDAGEIGAGHTVTALYEVVPAGVQGPEAQPQVDPLRYQTQRQAAPAAYDGELLTLKLRYKAPDGKKSRLISRPVKDSHRALGSTSAAFRFSAAVAGFGMLLRRSEHTGEARLERLRDLAASALEQDAHGDRRELLELMDAARRLGLDS